MGPQTVAILDSVHGKVPMLRKLKCSDGTGVGSCAAFEIAPNLSSVTIIGKASLRLPWTQLKSLRQRIPQIDGLSRLGSARNLVELFLTNSIPLTLALAAQARGMSELTLEFPLLRLLYIEDGEFLNFLLLPALEDIHIARRSSTLASLIDRSLCRLQKITSFDDVEEITPVLDRAPALLEIRLVLADDHFEHFVSHLTIPSHSDTEFRPPCTKLRTISLYKGLNEHQSNLLTQMMESRLRSNACSSLSVVEPSIGSSPG
ncbi:hypothetical protein K438DRAFT_602816 [Mycena galopus ATCC 62051]|nr:hypothetical protein K438DRAFT_602816 [Mycena galopus ATCC 62051]